jgi:hypothetical protein
MCLTPLFTELQTACRSAPSLLLNFNSPPHGTTVAAKEDLAYNENGNEANHFACLRIKFSHHDSWASFMKCR